MAAVAVEGMASIVKPIKVAIVGSGPSAFYSASRLLAHAGKDGKDVEVHMYERLPTPHGLVRYGVAPDHPEVKYVEHKFAQVAEHPAFRFFGNVNVTAQKDDTDRIRSNLSYPYRLATRISLSDLTPHYTHILLAYGCSLARHLGIPGSQPGELTNVHTALDFVNWYNGHPAAHDPSFLAQQPWLNIRLGKHMQHATIIGAGNVALDVARILLRARSTLHDLFSADSRIKARAALRETDVPESVLQVLSQSKIENVDIVARRGPAQVAFTNKELREMMELQDVTFIQPGKEHMDLAIEQIRILEEKAKRCSDDHREISEGERQAATSEARVRKRLLGIITKGSKGQSGRAQWRMFFFKSPKTLIGASEEKSSPVQTIRWNKMEFDTTISLKDREQPWSGDGSVNRIRSSGIEVETKTDMVVTSVGYKATPLDGSVSKSGGRLGWDDGKGIIPTMGGHALDGSGIALPGIYVSGWLARGPVGVIASTRIDANSVVEQLLHDWNTSEGQTGLNRPEQVAAGYPSVLETSTQRVVSWSDWLRLDEEELRRGKILGKMREKVLSIDEMLKVIG